MDTILDFSGSFSHSLDDKGRLALPGKLREELQNSQRPDEVTARADKDGYVVLYPYEQWLEIRAKIQAITSSVSREVAIREVISKAERLNVDKAGRVLISPTQREAAGLGKEVTVLGGMYKIEVWDRAKLEARRLIDANAFDAIRQAEDIPL